MKSKRRGSGIFKISRIMLLVSVLILLAGCQKKMTVQDYLDLGDKYLTEANYEEAIVAFTKAIEVEPKAMKAYEGLTNAYIKTENYEKAKEVLQSGISVYEGLAEDEKTDEFKLTYEELLKLEEKIKLYLDAENSLDVEENESETLAETDSTGVEQERLVAEAKEKYGSILEQVIDVMDRGTLEWEYYYTDDFEQFVDELDQPLIWQLEDGRYIGIYELGIYLGDMKNGIRSGTGAWYSDSKIGEFSELYIGSWLEDYPNGTGIYGCAYSWGDNYERWSHSGEFRDGLENGTIRDSIERIWSGEFDSEIVEYQVTMGVPDGLMQDDGGLVYRATIIKPDKSAAILNETERLCGYEEGDLMGVSSAMKE